MLKLFGQGQKGLKAEDLEKYAGLITSLGMKVPDGMVILTGIFLQIMKVLGLTKKSSPEELMKAECPEDLAVINGEILKEMKVGVPYAIRSSALSERGGTGIYHTSFFVPTGKRDDDLLELWGKEKEVYASEFTADAITWRKKNKAEIGMAILIQEVKGYKFQNFFLPQIAGVAYTSYQGLMTVRVVVGLGTKAVKGEGVVYNTPPSHATHFGRDIWDQEKADCFDLTTGRLAEVFSTYEEVHCAINFRTFCDLFKKLDELKKHGEFSLEWAINDDGITIVQIAPYQDRLPGEMGVDVKKFFLFVEGSDVFNSGRAQCNGLVYISNWSSVTASRLEALNDQMKGYLLIVPQEALSLLAGNGFDEDGKRSVRLGFHHFSNASAVIEKQQNYSDETRWGAMKLGLRLANHTKGQGATHFQQLCTRSDILFLGGSFDSHPLLTISGRMDYEEELAVWEVESVMVVDGRKKKGYVYIAKQAQSHRYSPTQIVDWSMELRDVANKLTEDDKQRALSEHFYIVHYAIGNEEGPVGFDPFRLDPDIVKERGLPGIKESVRIVLDNISPGRQTALKQYLEELYSRL